MVEKRWENWDLVGKIWWRSSIDTISYDLQLNSYVWKHHWLIHYMENLANTIQNIRWILVCTSVHIYIDIYIYIQYLEKGAVWDSSLGTLVLTSTTSLIDKVRVRQCQPCEVVHWTREQRRTVRAFGDVWPPPAALFEVLRRYHLDTGLFHSLKIGYLKILVMKNPSFSLFHGRKLRYTTFSDPPIWLTSNLTHAHPSIFGHISFRCGIVIPIYPSIHP